MGTGLRTMRTASQDKNSTMKKWEVECWRQADTIQTGVGIYVSKVRRNDDDEGYCKQETVG